ncbi:MAG TPA: membrane dipeptidase, partial [Rectinemataceae bacterium]|nr:membrane dipeptidase [Rectinemataceae bacterium]
HADDETINDALAASVAPMICSHTGPRSLQDFPRYLPDDLMLEIARAGGLVGLWPFFSGGRGVPDLRTFAEYAAHCADLIGPDHLAIGSDINGVPGNMAGYRNLFDSAKIITVLSERGFSDQEVAGIAGLNFLRFFRTVAK